MCKGFHVHLTTNWRSKDSPQLFDFYTGLYKQTDEDLPFAVQEAQEQFPLRESPIDIDIVLCVGHAKRAIINRRQNEAKARLHEDQVAQLHTSSGQAKT